MLARPRAPTNPNGRQHANADNAASIAAAGAPLSTTFTHALHNCATEHFAGWNTAITRAIDVSTTTQTKTFCATRPRLDVETIDTNAGRTHKSNRLGFGLRSDFNVMNLLLTA